jgi:ABC-type bacteriocin/lantibiotic exporter with double-glycine peptidase domain
MNYDKKDIEMQKYSHRLLLLVPSIAIVLIIIGMIVVPIMNHSAAAQLSQQRQNANISLATISEAARNLAHKLGINSTEVSLKPGQNMSELAKQLAPGSSLANFQEQLKGLGQQLGLNGTLLSQLRQQLPAVNITEAAQKLEQISGYIP